ncbi:MFS transporter [bacterium]|nr:MFS transporter [bacterium]
MSTTSLPPLDNSRLLLSNSIWWLFGTVGALSPMFPLYLGEIGLDSSDIALLFAVQGVTALLFGQVIGYLADMYFGKKTMLLVCTLLCAPIQAIFPLVPPTLGWLALATALHSIGYSQRVSILNSLIFESRGGEAMFGRVRLVGSLGFAVTTVLVGWLAGFEPFGIKAMWPALVFIDMMLTLCVVCMKDHPVELRRATARKLPSFRGVQQLLLSNPIVMRFLIFVLLFQLVSQSLHFLQVRFLQQLGSPPVFATSTLAVAAMAEIIVFYYGAQITARFSIVNLLALVPIGLALRYGLVFAFPTPWVILACSVLHMVGFGLAYLCSVIFINRETPPELKVSGQTLFAIVFSFVSGLLGNLIAAGILMVLEKRLGASPTEALRILFGIGAVFALLSLLAWLPMQRLYHRRDIAAKG